MKYGKLTFGQVEVVLNMVGGEDGVKRLLGGFSEVVLKEGVIDCDVAPAVPLGHRVVEHRKGGLVQWDPARVTFYVTDKQKDCTGPDGDQLRKDLASKRLINANMLDYLLDHQDQIPEEWRCDGASIRFIVFWGTVYSNEEDCLYVRAMHWNDDADRWDESVLELDWKETFDTPWAWNNRCPAAIWTW